MTHESAPRRDAAPRGGQERAARESTQDTPQDTPQNTLQNTWEAIVVGSGFGGAVTALRLAQAGVDTLLLERGRRFEAADFPALPPGNGFLPDLARWSWPNDQGLWDVLDLEEVVSVQAAGYGGGSLLYANVQLRAPSQVFDERWPDVYRPRPGGGDELSPYYDLVGAMLEAKPYGPAVSGQLVKASRLRKAAGNLGRSQGFFYPPIAVQQADGPNAHGVDQRACQNCGACSTGCPHRAKNTLDLNYLAIAERYSNFTARTQSEVVQLLEGTDGVWTVRYVDHLHAVTREVRARAVFLCAGSVHTTRLVQRAEFVSPGGKASQRLAGTGYFPGGDAIAVAFDTVEKHEPSVGPTITTTLVRWEPDASSFFLLQDGGYAREVARVIGALRAPLWMGRNRVTRSRAPSPPDGPRPPPSDVLTLNSPLDGVLDAARAGSFASVLPPALRRDLPEILREITRPLLLPEVVGDVITRAFREKARGRLPAFLSRPDGVFMRVLFAVMRRFIVWSFGTDEELAGHAAKALATAGGLPPERAAERILNYSDDGAEHRAMLLAMGRDAAPGVLLYEAAHDRQTADLELHELSPGYTKEEQLMADVSAELGGELRTNPAWAFLGKPVTVHNQGGCRMSDAPVHGVVDADGKVHGCDGLYVMDGAALSTSVGVNPSSTIAAIAERNVLRFIRARRGQAWPEGDTSAGAQEYARHQGLAAAFRRRAIEEQWPLEPPGLEVTGTPPFRTPPVGLAFDETMQGYFSPGAVVAPDDDAAYRAAESAGRPAHPLKLTLTVTAENVATFIEDPRHTLRVEGVVEFVPAGGGAAVRAPIDGTLELFAERVKPYGLDPVADADRLVAQCHASRSRCTTQVHTRATPGERRMVYSLEFAADGKRYRLTGYKRVRNDPGLDAWRDTSALFFTLKELKGSGEGVPAGAGVVHVDLTGFLFAQLPSLRVLGTEDPARRAWATTIFTTFFFGSLQRIYAPGLGAVATTLFRARRGDAGASRGSR